MQEKYKVQKAAALQYDKETQTAPTVVAKGQGEVAKNIIKIAKANDLPIKKDEDLVELLTKIDIGTEIPENMYKAVAEVFAFLYEVSKKNRDKA